MHLRLYAALVLTLLSPLAPSQNKPAVPLAATPPMGWNSWNWFAEKVTDKDVRQAANLLVSSGMRDAGYVYVNIDDTWEGTRDAKGVLHTNEKFPDMKALANYVHSKGLKLGIYSSPGLKTCARFEGSEGHEQQDADLYASWGIDLLKYDLCSLHKEMGVIAPGDKLKQNVIMRDAYMKMHLAIVKTGRPMVYSICQYGHDSLWEWAAEVGGNMWRTTADIDPTFFRIAQIGREQAGLAQYAGPGPWNDPDMIEVGNGKLTADENRTHMGLWHLVDSDLLNQIEATLARHLDVEKNHINRTRFQECGSLAAIPAFAADFDLRIGRKHPRHASACEGFIVDDQCPDVHASAVS
ncbi:MAG: Alpha-galactosidase [Acidobacteriaceae bacterium]|nr:Alpha-galactosidase [Acidobacteriaceae bacterium]